ncbi:MAG TPA: hypothetical protein PLZ51_07800, partial [Aggregatilineales bacterium]|nr:hypothetical protein [Aggregatilineales bacterium]
PLGKEGTIAVAGVAANDIGLACGGWTVVWQGEAGAITAGSTLLDGLVAHRGDAITYSATGDFKTKVDTAIVVVAEIPYAEGE